LATSKLCGSSYIVSDQKALTGGRWSGANRNVYWLAPVNGAPAESLAKLGYIASAAVLP